MGHLAEALGVQKGSLYSLTGSKQELLFETMREARVRFTRRSTRFPTTPLRSSGFGLRCADTSASSPPSSTSPPSSRGSGATSTGSTARRSSPSGAATRSDSARSSRTEWPPVEVRPDLDAGAAALLVLSAANWAYLARRRTRYGRARRPLHRDPRRRHPRLCDAPVNALLLVNPWASGVAEEQLESGAGGASARDGAADDERRR